MNRTAFVLCQPRAGRAYGVDDGAAGAAVGQMQVYLVKRKYPVIIYETTISDDIFAADYSYRIPQRPAGN